MPHLAALELLQHEVHGERDPHGVGARRAVRDVRLAHRPAGISGFSKKGAFLEPQMGTARFSGWWFLNINKGVGSSSPSAMSVFLIDLSRELID
jgi:hypothetical protein